MSDEIMETEATEPVAEEAEAQGVKDVYARGARPDSG
jgi:hypothetical protein